MAKKTYADRKLYPLTTGQHLLFLAWRFTLAKQVLNIPTSCLVHAPLDMAVLRQAVEQAIERNDSFAIRIVNLGKQDGKKVFRQYFGEHKATLIEEVDFTGKTQAEMEDFFHKVGRTKMKVYDNPLVMIYLVTAPDGSRGLFTNFNHLIIDSWGIGVFYKDVLALYYALKEGAPMPRAVGRFEKIVQREMEYEQSDRQKKDQEFWEKEIGGVPEIPYYTHVSGPALLEKARRKAKNPDYHFGPTLFLRTPGKQEVIEISKEDVDMMIDFCRDHAVSSPAQLFIMGMRTFLSKTNGRPYGISLHSMLHRRSSVEEKYSSGFRVHNLPMTTFMKEDITYLDALHSIMDTQNLYYRHADFDPIAIMNMQRKLWGYKLGQSTCSVGITFQPMQLELPDGVRVSSRWYCNSTSPQNCYLTIMDGDGSGGLRCYYEYNTTKVKPEEIHRCHDFMMKVIRTGATNPAISLKELLDMPLAGETTGERARLEPALE